MAGCPVSTEDVSLPRHRLLTLIQWALRLPSQGAEPRELYRGEMDDKGYYVCCNIHFPNSNVWEGEAVRAEQCYPRHLLSSATLCGSSCWASSCSLCLHDVLLHSFSPKSSTPMFSFANRPTCFHLLILDPLSVHERKTIIYRILVFSWTYCGVKNSPKHLFSTFLNSIQETCF